MTGVRLPCTVFGIGVAPLETGALACGGSWEKKELRGVAVCGLQRAWVMAGTDVSASDPEGGSGTTPDRGLGEPVSLGCEHQQRFSMFPAPLVGQDGLRGLELGMPLPRVRRAPITQQAGLRCTGFPGRQALLRGTSALRSFTVVSFSSLCWEPEGIFSDIHCENLVKLL